MAKKQFMVDNEPFDWDGDLITYEQLKDKASIPDNVLIFQKVPGKPDIEIKPGVTVNLALHPGIDRFSTQAPQSGAGNGTPS
ncbi:MAG: multiubiquitin domain-containing protein [Deltaproteobacteria bacterium]|nr:multiubiquitin domain-containing protein [Deltaproteobacteria bacterium]